MEDAFGIPGSSGGPPRTLELMMGNSEQIEVDLDNLPTEEEEFEYLLSCVKESEATGRECAIIAQEYWRRGHLSNARAIAKASIEKFTEEGKPQELPALHYLQSSLSLAYARQAPKMVLPADDVHQDRLDSSITQADYLGEAAGHLNAATKATGGMSGSTELLGYLTRGALQLAHRQTDEALRTFDGVLSKNPTNVVALLGKARIQYMRKQYKDALKTFQTVLQNGPLCLPDPRIGIGLCLWSLGDKDKARRAWERSLEVNPGNSAATLLLGLYHMNRSKDPMEEASKEDRQDTFVQASKLLTTVFKQNQWTSIGASAANAVAEILHRQRAPERALKLAERAIQFADSMSVLCDAQLRAGRACHDLGYIKSALKHYEAAAPKLPAGAIGKAQIHLLQDERAAAKHELDPLMTRSDCVEASLLMAVICAHPGRADSATDAAADAARARDILDRLSRAASTSKSRLALHWNDDSELHIDIARLWQTQSTDRASKAYAEAARVASIWNPNEPINPKLASNLGVMRHLEGDVETARDLYQQAITNAATNAEASDATITTIMYNLGRAYEELGDSTKAREAYDTLLSKHPEYIDAKIARARMFVALSRHEEAHQWIKQAMEAEPNNFNTRAFYTWYFYNCNRLKEGADFTSASLKMNSKDIYSLCAYGWFMHHAGREGRSRTEEANIDRAKTFNRAATSFINALTEDPSCAFAAQGLAMIVAEDVLDTWAPGKPVNDAKAKKDAREALLALTKIKESLNDGSVYVNMGHCHFVRDEFERAIESYETASERYYHGTNATTLLYLCRSWYAKANKDKSFSAMKTALKYAQQTLHLSPHDKSILYNLAMIEQKALEMLLAIEDLSKRSLEDLQKAIDHAKHAQKLFSSLATDESKGVPYNKEIADQRRKYGESMLRKAEAHITRQQEYEVQHAAQIEEVKRQREEELERQRAKQTEELEKKKAEQEALREQRRQAREEALQWAARLKEESDSDDERKAKRKGGAKKVKAEAGSGDEVVRKKKRGPRRRRAPIDDDGDEQMTGEASGEEAPRPERKKPRVKKRVVHDEDEEDEGENREAEGRGSKRRKTEYKSKETISDSDEDLE